MLDKLSETLGISSESLDQLLASSPRSEAVGPSHRGNQDGPATMPDQATQQPAGLNRIRKSASLKAIELLLRNPEIALTLQADLEPLRYAGDESQKLLLILIEKNPQGPINRNLPLTRLLLRNIPRWPADPVATGRERSPPGRCRSRIHTNTGQYIV